MIIANGYGLRVSMAEAGVAKIIGQAVSVRRAADFARTT
jgi:hypothetical protein